MQVLVIGSMNMDLVVETDRCPVAGETVTGRSFSQVPGGKGANQACAVGKLSGAVGFIGACGKDEYGNLLLESLKNAGVKTDHVEIVEKTTGIAVIILEQAGDNRIIIIPGANNELTPAIVKKNEEIIKQANILLLQLEIPLDTVIYAIEMASEYRKTVILDPAPACHLPFEIYDKIDFLLPNEVEIAGLVPDERYKTLDDKAKRLLELGARHVILTRGAEGVSLYTPGYKKHFAAKKVKAVDTTAAGDAFAGALAYGLHLNWGVEEAVEFANVAAGLSVTRFGAQSSLPDLNEVLQFKSEVG